jgi:hypothetical protein
MDKNTKYHANRIARVWPYLRWETKVYILALSYYYKYNVKMLINAITAGLIGGLLFTILGGSFIIALTVGILAGYYTLFVSLFILPKASRRSDDKDAGRFSR